MRQLILVSLLLIQCTVIAAENKPTEIQQLKADLETLKALYEEKVALLEQRIQQAEQQIKNTQLSAQRAESAARTVAASNNSATSSSNSFNPDFSIILSGIYAGYDQDPEEYELPGFQLGGEAGLSPEGFSVEHTELVMSANIDDKFYGYMTLALASEGGEVFTELEEAFVETTSLDNGFKIKLGRFYSDIGYLNNRHGHSWDFIDQPLVYDAMLGRNYTDDGLQLSWLAPTDLYTLVGIEAYRGDHFPGGGISDDEFGVQTAYLKLGGDWGTEHSWLAGISYWTGDIEQRMGGHAGHGADSHSVEAEADEHGHNAESAAFSGDSNLNIFELVYKWAPKGNPKDQNLTLQLEYFQRDEQGTVWLEGSEPLEMSRYNSNQSGYYVQGVYQFMPQWRFGLRYDELEVDTLADGQGIDEEVLEEAGFEGHGKPDRWTLMLDWSNSEYSRFRVQYSRQTIHGEMDNQWYFQYIMSLGAHGAHSF